MVKSGYKQTEIGVIPEDWEVCLFGSRVQIYRGGSPRPIQNYITQSFDGINWIKIGDVSENSKYISHTHERIISEGVSRSREVHVGDFILSNSMSFGRPYILNIDGCIHDGWLTIQKYEDSYDTEFLYYLLSSDLVYKQYISMAAGSSVKNLNKDKVNNLILLHPSLNEQKKIASTLSDMDNLIFSLEKLIAKKKLIKQGAMQELLTGKKRLPGVKGEWINVKISNVLQIGYGKSQNDIQTHYGKYPILATGGEIGRTDIPLYDKESVLIGRKGTIDKPQYIDKPFWTIDTLFYTIIKDQYCPKFIYYLFCIIDWNNYNEASGVPSLNSHVIENINVIIPPTLSEQQAIAKILTDMDNEIEALEKKLSKYQKIKQGMMYQLLTGKIRLI